MKESEMISYVVKQGWVKCQLRRCGDWQDPGSFACYKLDEAYHLAQMFPTVSKKDRVKRKI